MMDSMMEKLAKITKEAEEKYAIEREPSTQSFKMKGESESSSEKPE